MAKWRSMKTAPKDVPILVWGCAEGELSQKEREPGVHHVNNFFGGWSCMDCDGYSVWVAEPLCWTPEPKGLTNER